MTRNHPAAPSTPITNVTTVRVTYRDTDRMGHVYYANYLVWFEIGRTEMLRDLGMTYREWEDTHGVYLPVASCWIDYHKGALYDDVVRIETRIAALTRASITFEYRLLNDATGELLATGGTRHPFLSKDGRVLRVANKILPGLFAPTHQRG
ncbi:MAG: acyl-CoA thioesterase [Candidatus Sumerlaeaceae bacterium]|nr:acyl-CoA thioesterase [Candidatus Sumerlaeaceae bacterium]